MITEAVRNQRDTLLAWLVANTIAVPIAALVAVLLGVFTVGLGYFIFGAVAGAVLAFAQWIVLNGRFPQLEPRRWVIGTATAAQVVWTVAFSLTRTLTDVPLASVISVAAALLLWTAIGGVQFLFLRREVPGFVWWIPANAFWGVSASVVGGALGLAASDSLNFLVAWALGATVAGALFGAGTGITLVCLPSLKGMLHDPGRQRCRP